MTKREYNQLVKSIMWLRKFLLITLKQKNEILKSITEIYNLTNKKQITF